MVLMSMKQLCEHDLSTGIIGADRRYVMVIESLQPSDDATARATITQAVTTMFPAGRIGA